MTTQHTLQELRAHYTLHAERITQHQAELRNPTPTKNKTSPGIARSFLLTTSLRSCDIGKKSAYRSIIEYFGANYTPKKRSKNAFSFSIIVCFFFSRLLFPNIDIGGISLSILVPPVRSSPSLIASSINFFVSSGFNLSSTIPPPTKPN